MAFSYTAVWEDTMRMVRAHAALLAPVAGAMIFLPAALIALVFPEPAGQNPATLFRELGDYFAGIWHWLALRALIGTIGTAAILRLVLVPGTRVGDAMVFGVMALPAYFLVSLLSGLIIGFGFLLLIVPGLYLIGRLVSAAPLLIAQGQGPIAAIRGSFRLSKGRGWVVFGLVLIVGFVGAMAAGMASTVTGTILILAAGRETGMAVNAIISAALDTALGVLLLLLYAAIYRALAAGPSVAGAFD